MRCFPLSTTCCMFTSVMPTSALILTPPPRPPLLEQHLFLDLLPTIGTKIERVMGFATFKWLRYELCCTGIKDIMQSLQCDLGTTAKTMHSQFHSQSRSLVCLFPLNPRWKRLFALTLVWRQHMEPEGIFRTQACIPNFTKLWIMFARLFEKCFGMICCPLFFHIAFC